MKIKPSAIARLLGLTSFFLSCSTLADECDTHARNPMEMAYCQVKASRYGATLPSLYRFRKNSEKTQRLLLKTPAQKAGVELPPEKPTDPVKRATIEESMPEVSNTIEQAPQVSMQELHEIQTERKIDSGLNHCNLHREQISCELGLYTLLKNQQNKELSAGALTASNRLELPKKDQPNYSTYNHAQFLSASYKIYIEKMLNIGLAAATMSYSKFATTYQLHFGNGTDPVERFATMYELLKKEKKTNVVRASYSDELPQSLEQCMPLGEKFIVCDNIQTNWVFRKQTSRGKQQN